MRPLGYYLELFYFHPRPARRRSRVHHIPPQESMDQMDDDCAVDIVLSRRQYASGTPLVGTVRVRRLPSQFPAAVGAKVRDEIRSARLYAAGRASLGSYRRGRGGGGVAVGRWRSPAELGQLRTVYGDEHPCLSRAKLDELSSGSNAGDRPATTTSIELADRCAVHTLLHPKSAIRLEDCEELPSPVQCNIVCHWMTNVLDLTSLPERHESDGRAKLHGEMHPFQPLKLPDLDVVREALSDLAEDGIESRSLEAGDDEFKAEEKTEDDDETNADKLSAWERVCESADRLAPTPDFHDRTPLENTQFAATFRVNLPGDLPPSMSAECAGYFYSVVLVIETASGKVNNACLQTQFDLSSNLITCISTQVIERQCPFKVVTSSETDQTQASSTTRVRIATLTAYAHSAGLPAFITSTEISAQQQIRVVSNPPALDFMSRRTREQRISKHRITDRRGAFCASMTLIGKSI